MNTIRFNPIWATVLCAIFLASCSAPSIKQRVLMPANAKAMQNSKTVAIVSFSGDENNEFSSQMETFFTNLRVQHKPYFKVVDRNMMESILQEQKISFRHGGLRTNDAANVGKLTGADTLITGFVRWPEFTNKRSKEKRSRCVKHEGKTKVTPLGVKFRKCLKQQEYYVKCTKQQGEFNFTLKVVSIKSGEIAFTKAYRAKTSNDYCKDNKSARKEESDLERIVIAKAIAQMRQDVAPYSVVLNIKLMKKDDSRMSSNEVAQSLLISGFKFAKSGRIDRACQQFEGANKSFPSSPAITHNLGVCAEVKNDFTTALALYKKADQLSQRPEKLINSALNRVNRREYQEAQVKKQLR